MDSRKVELIQKTLSWLNETFVSVVGMKPLEDLPLGTKGHGDSCVLANALRQNAPLSSGEWFVDGKNIFINGEGRLVDEREDKYGCGEWPLPSEAMELIQLFDSGNFQELDESYLDPYTTSNSS